MKKTTLVIIFIALLFAIAYDYFGMPVIQLEIRSAPEIKVAFFGDQGNGQDAAKVLQLIKSEGAELALNQGDFDYVDNPDAWDKMTDTYLGKEFLMYSTIGNHDELKWKEYQKKIIEQISHSPDFTCIGDIGTHATCSYKNIDLISIAPAIASIKQQNYTEYISKNLGENSAHNWDLCLWHKNNKLLQTGQKNDDVSLDMYDSCRKTGALIITAHEHVYSRTYLMSDFKKQTVVSTSSVLATKPGRTFVVVSGLGGRSIRPQVRKDAWWASVYSQTQNAKPGALFCVFNKNNDPKRAECYFKNIKGEVVDSFDVTR